MIDWLREAPILSEYGRISTIASAAWMLEGLSYYSGLPSPLRPQQPVTGWARRRSSPRPEAIPQTANLESPNGLHERSASPSAAPRAKARNSKGWDGAASGVFLGLAKRPM